KQIREKNSQGKVIAKYTYDYLGNRVQKEVFNVPGKSKITYYPDENFVKEMDEQGRARDVVYYSLDSDLVAKKENNQMFYYHPDHLGSTSVVTDERGRIIENNHYLPFGEILEKVNERYLFTGQELDPESQLYYYGARYYSPYLSKFTQPDTVIQDVYNPQNLNRYSYVLNNPYKYNDPSGNYFETVLDIGFVVWDVVDIVKNPLNTDNWISLGLDLVSTATPVVAGLGRVYKAGKGLRAADKVIDAEKTFESFKNTDEAFKYYSKDPVFRKSYKETKDLFKSGKGGEIKVRSLDEGRSIVSNLFPPYKKFDPVIGPVSQAPKLKPGRYSIEVKDAKTGLVPGHVPSGKHASVNHIKILTEEKKKIYLIVEDMTK
ncbi:MAG: RHS repeat-associated core domain-containing protein, partial [Nanoarchaeota archaeon]